MFVLLLLALLENFKMMRILDNNYWNNQVILKLLTYLQKPVIASNDMHQWIDEPRINDHQ